MQKNILILQYLTTANYGIVGDMYKIVPELTKMIKEAK